MAENKSSPDPFWPAEKVQAVADKLYRDMAPLMKTEGELLLAHTVAELMAAHFQIVEALMAGRRADQSACDLSNALKNQWNVQMDGVSRRLKKLEKRRRNPLRAMQTSSPARPCLRERKALLDRAFKTLWWMCRAVEEFRRNELGECNQFGEPIACRPSKETGHG